MTDDTAKGAMKGEAPSTGADRAQTVVTWLLPLLGSALVFYLAWPFLTGAVNRAWDDLFHQTTQHLVADAIEQGRSPFGLLPTHFGIPGLRIYQCLHPLIAGTIEWLTGLSTQVVHSWLVAIFFALTPWTYRHFLTSLGLDPMAASIAGLLYIGSTAGFGNSFEAYYELGIVTQALGSVLMPLGMAKIVRICKEGEGYVGAAVFLSLTMMTHAMYAIYALLISVFIVLFYAKRIKTLLLLGLAAGLAVVLCLGWVLPFLALRVEHKSVTDMVARPDRIVWSAGHSGGSLGRALVSGRTLDGGRKDGTADEKLDNRLNMTFTREVRFPYYTILAAIGVMMAAIGHRRRENRVLVSGLAAGLLLILGFDDFPILNHLPVFNQIQAFRVGYFIEFFGIALAGFGAWRLLTLLVRAARKIAPEPALRWGVLGLLLVASAAYIVDTVRIQTPLLDSWDPKHFKNLELKLAKAGAPDPERRVLMKFSPPPSRQFRFASEHALEVMYGYRSLCNHWTSLSPSVNLHICGQLFHPERNPALARLAGVRYLIINHRQRDQFLPDYPEPTEDHRLLGRRGRYMYVLEDRHASMLHAPPGPRVLVICDPDKWYWLTRSWADRFSSRIGEPEVPWLVRGTSEVLRDEDLMKMFDGIMYVDDDHIEDDLSSLKRIATGGASILLGRKIDGIDAKVMRPSSKSWDKLLGLKKRPAAAFEKARLDDRSDPQNIEYSVSLDRPGFVTLSMETYRNWTATVDDEPALVMSSGPDLVTIGLREGKHTVRFRFEPTSLESATTGISLTAWLALILYHLFLVVRRILPRLRRSRDHDGPKEQAANP